MTSRQPRLSRRSLLAGSAATAAAVTLVPDRADARPLVGRTLAQGLVVPWGLAFLPNGDALVTERESGRVHRVSRNGGRRQVAVLRDVFAPDPGEGGLLGCAVSPGFSRNRHVFFYLTTRAGNQVVRMTYANGTLSHRTPIFGPIPAGANHNGGRLRFGRDGRLFVTTGDTRSSALAQNPRSYAGKILRINANGTIPSDNPFGNAVWTRGHRNVEGLAVGPDGRLWATELGENTRDELNRILKGRNYGWPAVEGGDGPGGFTDPFATWSPTSTCSPSGVAIARGRAWVGALAGHSLYSVDLGGKTPGRKIRWFDDTLGRIRTVERAPDGTLWVTTSNRDGRGRPRAGDDKVVRIRFG